MYVCVYTVALTVRWAIVSHIVSAVDQSKDGLTTVEDSNNALWT